MQLHEAANNTHFLKQLDEVPGGISLGQLVSCNDHLRRTVEQPEKKANYVCNTTVGEYVEVPQVLLFSTELYLYVFWYITVVEDGAHLVSVEIHATVPNTAQGDSLCPER